MNIEYEAMFGDISKDEIVAKLIAVGAKLIKPNFLQKRVNFDLPGSKRSDNAWVRVRDEGDKTTLTLKIMEGSKSISSQKELEFGIDNFAAATQLLEAIGCEKRQYQETWRELWTMEVNNQKVDITIDEWPFLNPFIEIEGPNEESVKKVCAALDLDYSKALFGTVNLLYKERYGKALEELEPNVKEFKFDIPNPFL